MCQYWQTAIFLHTLDVYTDLVSNPARFLSVLEIPGKQTLWQKCSLFNLLKVWEEGWYEMSEQHEREKGCEARKEERKYNVLYCQGKTAFPGIHIWLLGPETLSGNHCTFRTSQWVLCERRGISLPDPCTLPAVANSVK